MQYEIFKDAKKEIFISLRKGFTKKDWKAHARSLQNLHKKTTKVEKLIEILNIIIPKIQKLQDSIPKNKSKYSLWYILMRELRELNFILTELEEKNEISSRIIRRFEELTDWANLEETALHNI